MKKTEINIDEFLKRKVLIFKKYVFPYFKNEQTVEIDMSKLDIEFLEHLQKTFKLDKALIFNAFIYENAVEEMTQEDKRIISVCELLNILENAKDLDNKILFINEEHKYKITKIK